MINLLKSLHLLTLFYISDALFKRQNSLVRSNRLYGESTVVVYIVQYTIVRVLLKVWIEKCLKLANSKDTVQYINIG